MSAEATASASSSSPGASNEPASKAGPSQEPEDSAYVALSEDALAGSDSLGAIFETAYTTTGTSRNVSTDDYDDLFAGGSDDEMDRLAAEESSLFAADHPTRLRSPGRTHVQTSPDESLQSLHSYSAGGVNSYTYSNASMSSHPLGYFREFTPSRRYGPQQ